MRRAVGDRRQGIRFHPPSEVPAGWHKWKETRSPLWNDEGEVDLELERGKVQNLRVAVRRLNGARVEASEVFSFWAQIGQATRARGFVAGRLLREGCLMPAVGGGLCQLSNALYELALHCGFEVLERHAHSRVVPGSSAIIGRDATVAWNYIDLRFRSNQTFVIGAQLTRDELLVSLWCADAKPVAKTKTLLSIPLLDARLRLDARAHSCASCDETGCFRHEFKPRQTQGQVAWLVDENWPEWKTLAGDERGQNDVLLAPTDADWPRLGSGGWSLDGWNRTGTAPRQALNRSLLMRRAARKGANVWQAQLSATRSLAWALERRIPFDATHLVVAQSLLPFLWQSGALGGRSFDVLLTRTPLDQLAAQLDDAFALLGDATLSDFRAPGAVVRAEREALDCARRLVTPHEFVAREFGSRAQSVVWHQPESRQAEWDGPRDALVFPGPGVARKGVHAVRDAARELKMPIVTLGRDFMGDDFWRGVEQRVLAPGESWLAHARVVVQPALIEGEPRALLRALAAGVPVVATEQCGLGEREGVSLVDFGDASAIARAIRCL